MNLRDSTHPNPSNSTHTDAGASESTDAINNSLDIGSKTLETEPSTIASSSSNSTSLFPTSGGPSSLIGSGPRLASLSDNLSNVRNFKVLYDPFLDASKSRNAGLICRYQDDLTEEVRKNPTKHTLERLHQLMSTLGTSLLGQERSLGPQTHSSELQLSNFKDKEGFQGHADPCAV